MKIDEYKKYSEIEYEKGNFPCLLCKKKIDISKTDYTDLTHVYRRETRKGEYMHCDFTFYFHLECFENAAGPNFYIELPKFTR